MKKRLNGISTPVGGVSWENVASEKAIVKRMFVFLHSKRILVNPIEMEILEQCISSVLEIRKTLVVFAQDISEKTITYEEINKMIMACNNYLDSANRMNLPHIIYKKGDNWSDLEFDSSMKAFRNVFKNSIARLENLHNLESHIIVSEKW